MLIPESRDPESPGLDFPGIGLSIAGLTAIVWALIEAPEQRLDQRPDPRRVRRRRRDPRRVHRLGAPSEAADAGRERVPQPALQRGECRRHVRVLRADGRHVLPHHVPAVGAGVHGAGGGSADDADRCRPDPRDPALGPPDRAIRDQGRRRRAAWPWSVSPSARSPPSRSTRRTSTRSWVRSRSWASAWGSPWHPPPTRSWASLPKAKAGIGSAMNDVVRELGGTLGVAVLGSVVSSTYAANMDEPTAGLPHGGGRGRQRQRRRRARGRRSAWRRGAPRSSRRRTRRSSTR